MTSSQTSQAPDIINRNSLGQNILQARKVLGMGRIPFAKLMGVAPTTIQSYENGERNPSLEFIVTMSQLTGKSVDELLAGTVIHSVNIESEALNQIKRRLLDINREVNSLINTL